jgi:membrane-associated phospholipid phosphatase
MKMYFAGVLAFCLFLAGLYFFVGDFQTILWVSEHHLAFWDPFFAFMTKMGEAWPIAISIILFLIIRYPLAIGIALLSGLTSFCAWVLKTTFSHPRPRTVLDAEGMLCDLRVVAGLTIYNGNNSFPSGHTMAAFGIYTFLACWFRHRPLIQGLLLLLAIGVGISRIYLLNHFPSDVCAGAFVGTLLGFGCFSLTRLGIRKWKV